MSMSEYILKFVKDCTIIVIDKEQFRNLTYEISKIGNNINQIVYLCNQDKYATGDIIILVKTRVILTPALCLFIFYLESYEMSTVKIY